ncbi:MAG: hypothetical protein R2939_05885 [Kofleriaceae bacterium]
MRARPSTGSATGVAALSGRGGWLAICALAACTTRAGTPDRELGALVESQQVAPTPIDLAAAARSPDELGRALAQPHTVAEAALGPHVTTISALNRVSAEGGAVDELAVDTRLELGAGGSFHALSNNSADYGEEIIFLDGQLYLRPRYARWHQRPPTDDREPAALRTRVVGDLAATWELLAPGAALTDGGATTVGGRPAHKVTIAPAATPRPNPPEPLRQRAWRATRVIEAVEGEVVLDDASGVPLSASLRGRVGFGRDGRAYVMVLEVRHGVDGIGAAPTIAAPPADDVVATPERSTEVDERDDLLRGIAPPARAGAARGAP